MMGFGSVRNCMNVFDALNEKYTHVNFNIIRTRSDLDKIIVRKPDLVYTGIKYVVFDKKKITKNIKDKIWISEFFDNVGINYTGSGKKAIELEFSKDAAKKRVAEYGINTASYFVAKPGIYKTVDELPVSFPLFIKPLREGDGKGIGIDSIVYDFESYQKKVKSIYDSFQQSALVEKYLSGREFTVSILDSEFNIEPIAMPAEITFPGKKSNERILGYETKKENREMVIAIDNEDIFKSVASIAKRSFKALGARDFGRIDIIMDENNCPYFIEANLVPGMTQRPNDIDSSYFPRACFINSHITYQETVQKIAEIAINRLEGKLIQEKRAS